MKRNHKFIEEATRFWGRRSSTKLPINKLEEDFFSLFRGRIDTVGVSDKFAIPVSSEKNLSPFVVDHIIGKRRLGFFNLLPDLTCPWAMIEFEDHGKPGDTKDPEKRSIEFLNHMKSIGVSVYRELSKNPNGKCYHLWIFFDKPIPAKKVRSVFITFLRDVMQVTTEVFPKGYEKDSLGNFVWLPLFSGKDTLGDGINQNRSIFIDEKGKRISDQHSLLLKIKRTTETELDKLVDEYKLDLSSPEQNNTIAQLIEGLDKVRECKFMKYCEDNAATLTEPLWYAWITNAAYCIGGKDYIHQYSSLYPKYNQVKTDKKINHALKASGPMTHGKIKELGGICDCPEHFVSPISRVTYVDIESEIKSIPTLPSSNEQIVATKKLLSYWGKLPIVDKELWKPKLKKELKISDDLFNTYDLFDVTHIVKNEKELSKILSNMIRASIRAEKQGEAMYSWLMQNGAHSFKDKEKNVFLHIDKQMLLVHSENSLFRSYFYDKTGISLQRQEAKIIVDVIQSKIQKEGRKIENDTWLYTDHKSFKLYYHLNNESDEVLCIAPDSISVLENGSNPGHILLMPSNKISEIKYRQVTDTEYTDGMLKIKRLIIDNMACKESDRLLCYSWHLAGMFCDLIQTTPHLRLEGDSSSGKTTAMQLLSYLVYGSDQKKKGTTASNYADGSRNPYVFLDNVETKNMNQAFNDFILTAVTGIVNEKRDMETAHGVIQERTKCLICTSGIENMKLNEIINRTYIVDFDKDKYFSKFNDSVFQEIKMHRDEMLSAEFKLVSNVLMKMSNGVWDSYKTKIDTDYPKHDKERTNAFIAVMAIIAEELFFALGKKEKIWTMVKTWIDDQRDSASSTSTESNPIVQGLENLRLDAIKYQAGPTQYEWKYDVQIHSVTGEKVILYGTANQFHSSFSKAAKERGLQYEMKDAKQLASRIKDGLKTIKASNWIKDVSVQKAAGNKNSYTFKYDPEGSEVTTAPVPQAAPHSRSDEFGVDLKETA